MTVNDIVDAVMALCSQIDNTGTAKTDNTADGYKNKIPFFANLGQNELLQFMKYKKTDRKTLAKVSGEGFRVVTKPTDCGIIKSVTDKWGRNLIDEPIFSYEYNGNLYVTNNYEGEIIIIYIPIAPPITSLTSIFTLPDTYINPCLVYFIAYNLIKNSDGASAGLYIQKYEELRNSLKKLKSVKFGKIADVYGIS